MTDSLSQYCPNCEAQANTIEELRAANERWVIAFYLAEACAKDRIEALQSDKDQCETALKVTARACADHLSTVLQLRSELKALQAEKEKLRGLVATLWCASGGSCCRDDKTWKRVSGELAEIFGIRKFDDGSGYDWYSLDEAALQETEQ